MKSRSSRLTTMNEARRAIWCSVRLLRMLSILSVLLELVGDCEVLSTAVEEWCYRVSLRVRLLVVVSRLLFGSSEVFHFEPRSKDHGNRQSLFMDLYTGSNKWQAL